MNSQNRIRVSILGKEYEYEKGIRIEEIAHSLRDLYPHDIILCRVDGKLNELHKTLDEDCQLEFVTIGERVGEQTYRRSATLLLTKAVRDILGKDSKLIVQFSLHRGYYCEIQGQMPLPEDIITQLQDRMEELTRQDLPIFKMTLSLRDAQKIFEENGMRDKEKLLKYRRASRINIYQLDDMYDYYYGYMAPSTGYIKWYALVPYKDGFVLQMPVASEPEKVEPFLATDKLFNVLKTSTIWGERLGVSNVGDLNDCITEGDFMELQLVAEALQEKNIADIAEEIAESGKRIVLIAGPSSSGKTTFSHRLSVQLRAKGLKPQPIAVDDYFIDREKTPRDENGNYNYECLEALNIDQFNKDITELIKGKRVEMPKFNFITGKSEYGKDNFLQVSPDAVLVIEGIHCLNDKLTYSIPKENKYKIYISALTQLNVDEHNRIATTDGRLIRRIVRDAAHRGATAAHTIGMWGSVRRGEEENIFPYQENADVQFDSSLIYELSVLKQFAEPLLFNIKPGEPEYEEAKRLLKFLDYFIGVTSENVPKNSILREFIGGSCFNV